MSLPKFAKPLAAVLILAAAAGGYYYYQQTHTEKGITLYGNVDVRQVQLAFNASERIDVMNVEEGATVKKGDVLAKLRTNTLELNILQSKAEIAAQTALVDELHNGSRPQEIVSAEAVQSEAAANMENARIYMVRMQSLYAQNAVSKQTVDDAEAKYKAAKGTYDSATAAYDLAAIGPREEEIRQAEAKLQSLEANLKLLEYNLEQATLIAPIDGVVRSRLAEPGDMATPSKSVFLLTVDNKKWIRAYVSETQLGMIQPGMEANVTIDSQPDKPIKGTIGYISDTAEFTPKNVQTTDLRTSLLYEIRVYVDDPDNVLRLGMPATVTFD